MLVQIGVAQEQKDTFAELTLSIVCFRRSTVKTSTMDAAPCASTIRKCRR